MSLASRSLRFVCALAGVDAMAGAAADDPATHGLLITRQNGDQFANPPVAIVSQASRDMLKFASEFGMTPVSRGRIDIVPDRGPRKFGDLLAAPPHDWGA
jgi:P27 family predicted phage terminase small subunit